MKYIGFYDVELNRRNICLSATNKMNYIAEKISDLGLPVEFISASTTAPYDIEGCVEKIDENISIKFFKAYKSSRNKLKRIFHILMNRIKLFLYCLINIKKGEQVIVYHSLDLMRPIYYAKKLKGFKLILEVEEIYNDVSDKSNSSKKMERKFIACADKYIFPTELLNEKFNKEKKPFLIILGTYKTEDEKAYKFNDGKIHCVYSGTFDPRKGAPAAAKAAEWLPVNYHLHFLGFGNEEMTNNIKNIINETNEISEATLTYDGLLSGSEYTEFLQKCDIGLSTQNPDESYNATSFPSKILSYMANGLRVVSIKIPAIEKSAIGNSMYYYEEQSPEEIAKAIQSVDINDGNDVRKRIRELDAIFQKDLKAILEGDKQ